MQLLKVILNRVTGDIKLLGYSPLGSFRSSICMIMRSICIEVTLFAILCFCFFAKDVVLNYFNTTNDWLTSTRISRFLTSGSITPECQYLLFHKVAQVARNEHGPN
jgi:hypothetical protein